jgi:hypothetical protein
MVFLVGATAYLTAVVAVFTLYWKGQEGNWAAGVGHEIGTSIIPSVIVLLYYKVRKQITTTARVICVLTTWIFFANLISIGSNRPQLTEADIPAIAKEAAGLVPITNPNDAARTAVRDYFKEIIALNKNYFSRVRTINLEGLYTQQSYLDANETKRIVSQLDNATEIEQAQEDALDGIVERYKKRIDSLDWSEEYKRAFMKGFDEKYQESIAVRRPVVASEKEWMNSLRDLYVFVSNKRPYFRRSGDKIAIVQTETLDQFNEKIGHANELRQKYLDSKKLFDEKEKEGLEKLGLSAHDLGRAE